MKFTLCGIVVLMMLAVSGCGSSDDSDRPDTAAEKEARFQRSILKERMNATQQWEIDAIQRRVEEHKQDKYVNMVLDGVGAPGR